VFRDYPPLDFVMLQPGVPYARPTQTLPEKVTLDAAALEVMTDFESTTAIIILPADTVDEAHSRMIQRAVRLLLVVDENRSVLGVITATDILGEKPVQVAVERGSVRGEIQVRDIMTPREHIEVLDMAAVRGAKVGHVVATLSKAGRQHAVVVERDRYGGQIVRGLFSATQIARQLGVTMQMTEVARTFSEIEATLAR
jgi:CBS domain containing-hemolysin-like protein